MQEKGVNLIEKAFEQVTDEQIQAYQLKTGKQRMDKVQIASNIREMIRLHLLVEASSLTVLSFITRLNMAVCWTWPRLN